MSRRGEYPRPALATMLCPAWAALSHTAMALYPWLLFEWKGPGNTDNGHIRLSVRQATKRLGCGIATAQRAFHDLQAKGFLVVTRCAAPGSVGNRRGHEYEITELGTTASPAPRMLFCDWTPGCDFPVAKAKSNNPRGAGGFVKLETAPAEQAASVSKNRTDWCPRLSLK
jgi:hypothetical protein